MRVKLFIVLILALFLTSCIGVGDGVYTPKSFDEEGTPTPTATPTPTPTPTPDPSDNPPSLSVISNQTISENSPMTTVDANDSNSSGDTDADGDLITYSCYHDTTINASVANVTLCTSLTGVSFNSTTGVMDWTPNYTQAGNYEFKIIADEGDLTDSAIFTIVVSNTNQAPLLVAIADETIDEATAMTQVDGTDTSGGDTDADGQALTYTCTFDTSIDGAVAAGANCTTLTGISFNASTGVIDWTPDYTQAGDYEFKLVASDGSLSDDEIFAITVNNANRPADATAINPASFYTGDESIITLAYTDDENDLATACNLSSLSNVTITTPCSCDGGGVCTVGVTSTASYYGAGSFNYTVTTNGATSTAATATLDIISPFITTWRTTAPSETITLPLRPAFTYNFTVDWGDGSPVDTITSFSDPLRIHSYAVAGDYTVTIKGTVGAWYFFNTGDKDKILAVNNLGSVGWTNLSYAFHGCSNLTSVQGGDTSSVTAMNYMFALTPALTTIGLTSYDTSAVTDMGFMFYGASAVTSLDFSNFNTSSVISMAWMFRQASSLTTLDLSSFNTSNVSSMASMFQLASGLTSINLSSFTTSAVTNMSYMFSNATALTSIDLSGFDTSSVISMNYMFYWATNLSTLNLSNFNTANVTNMSSMFQQTSSLTTLNATGWDLSMIGVGTGDQNVFTGTNGSLVVTCDQPGGFLFTEPCN